MVVFKGVEVAELGIGHLFTFINPQSAYARVIVVSLSVCQHLILKTVAFSRLKRTQRELG